MKLCINCKHYAGYQQCARTTSIDPVAGRKRIGYVDANIERATYDPLPGRTTSDPCGLDGQHWEEAPPPPPAPKKPSSWLQRFPALYARLF